MSAYVASKKDWYLDRFNINWVDKEDKASLVIDDIGRIKDLKVHLTVFRPTWTFRFAHHHDVATIFERIFGSGTGGIHVTLESPEESAPDPDKKEVGIHCYVNGPNQGRDADEKAKLDELLAKFVLKYKQDIAKARSDFDSFEFTDCDDPDKTYDYLSRDVESDGFAKIAAIASERHGIKVVYPGQSDTALTFATASVHPMQSLQNTYQRLVRDACRGLQGDKATARESEELGKFFYFNPTAPKLMGMPQDAPPDVATQLEEAEKTLNTLKRELPDSTPEQSEKHLKALYDGLWKLRNLFNGAQSVDEKKKAKAVPGLAATEKHLKGFEKAMKAAKISNKAAEAFEVIRARLGKAHLEISFAIAGMCSIQNFHTIEPFYLFRLLVKFQIQSKDKIDTSIRTKVSSSLTGLLHNGKHVDWLFDWLRDKLVELDKALASACPDKGPATKRWPGGEPAVVFFLKGGRAAKYLQAIERKGENDWDTNIVINPYLRAGDWYRNFLAVHNTVLLFLEKAKREFCVRVFQGDAYDGLVKSILEMESADKAERGKKKSEAQSSLEEREFNKLAADMGSELVSDRESGFYARAEAQLQAMEDAEKKARFEGSPLDGLETENCKAELIDIGIPRRDTVEAFEQWGNVCPHVIHCPDNIPIPGHLYYIAEYVTMIREAFMDKCISLPKTPKRVIRLLEVLNMDALDPFVKEEEKHIPTALKGSVDGVSGLTPPVKRMLTILLAQFSEAYELAKDGDLAKCFDKAFSADLADRATKAKYPESLKKAITDEKDYKAEHKAVADAIGYAQWIAQEFAKHLREERAKFIREKSKELIQFVKAIYTGSLFETGDDLEVQFAVTGAFAADLHARYAGFERMEELEPVNRLDLKIFCKPGTVPASVFEMIDPLIKTFLLGKKFDVTKLGKEKLVMFWPEKVTFSPSLEYKPLVAMITVETCPEDWPQLAFIKGMPVLGLRDLIWEYKRRAGGVEETFTQRGLKTAIDGLTDILTRFENQDPGKAWTPQPVPVQAQVGPPVEPQDPQPPQVAPATVVKEVADLEFIPQKKSNWCWAAASLMMRRFYLKDKSTLEEVVGEIHLGLEDAQSALRLSRLKPKSPVEGTLLTWEAIKTLIDTSKPFIFAKDGHYWVCYGYEESPALKNLLYWDPLPKETGAKAKMTYDQYAARIQSGGATAHTFEIQTRKVLLPLGINRGSLGASDSLILDCLDRRLGVTSCELRVRHARNALGEIGAVILRKDFPGAAPATFTWDMKLSEKAWDGNGKRMDIKVEVEATLRAGEERDPLAGTTQVPMMLEKPVLA